MLCFFCASHLQNTPLTDIIKGIFFCAIFLSALAKSKRTESDESGLVIHQQEKNAESIKHLISFSFLDFILYIYFSVVSHVSSQATMDSQEFLKAPPPAVFVGFVGRRAAGCYDSVFLSNVFGVHIFALVLAPFRHVGSLARALRGNANRLETI